MLCLILCLHGSVFAARPEVALANDPRIHINCNKSTSDALVLSTAVASPSRAGGQLLLYQAGFNVAKRSGSLQKRRVGWTGASRVTGKNKPMWEAADLIAAPGRKIYTSRIDQDGVLRTIPFLWERLSTQQQAWLNHSALANVDDHSGPERLDYLRGGRHRETSMAGGVFRSRSGLLGMIVNSAPIYLGAPATGLSGTDYRSFQLANRERVPVVFVGANDGALHAFNADTGRELFAYIPDFLFSGLSALTAPGAAYRPYVDAPIAVAEARAAQRWATVLVAGVGGGAQGVFALDVSDAAQFGTREGALWEFSDADDAALGNVVAAPLIGKFRTDLRGVDPVYRYFAVVAGGLNSYQDDAHRSGANGVNSLFLLALDKKVSEPWQDGKNYYRIVLPSGIARVANGLTGVTAVLDGAGAVRHLYAVDLQGNLWRIDPGSDTRWSTASEKSEPRLVFSARDENEDRQAITQAPVVLYAADGYLIVFGTGKYMEQADLEQSGFRTQSFYAILDNPDENGKTILRRHLSQRMLRPTSRDDHVLALSGTAPDDPSMGQSRGWYFDFLDSDRTGERSISAVTAVDGRLFFNTLIPASKPCQSNQSRGYSVNAMNGLPLSATLASDLGVTGVLSDTGLWQAPIMLEVTPPDDPKSGTTSKRRVTRKMIRLEADGTPAREPADVTTIQQTPIQRVEIGGQLSWHEIVNWHELNPPEAGKQ